MNKVMDHDQQQKLLAELGAIFAFVGELSGAQLQELVNNSTVQEAPAGTVLVDKISDCPGLALILFGELHVSRISVDGREVLLYRVEKGRTCPLSAACILGNLVVDSVRVVADIDTKIWWVSRDYFKRSLVECEPFWRFVFGCVSSRLFDIMEIVDNVAFVSVKKRLAQILLMQSDYGKLPVYRTHEGLARELGSAREVVSRELKNFERAGILSLARGRLLVKKPEMLGMVAKTPTNR